MLHDRWAWSLHPRLRRTLSAPTHTQTSHIAMALSPTRTGGARRGGVRRRSVRYRQWQVWAGELEIEWQRGDIVVRVRHDRSSTMRSSWEGKESGSSEMCGDLARGRRAENRKSGLRFPLLCLWAPAALCWCFCRRHLQLLHPLGVIINQSISVVQFPLIPYLFHLSHGITNRTEQTRREMKDLAINVELVLRNKELQVRIDFMHGY